MKESWEIKKLGEVLNLEYGKPLDNLKRIVDGKYPVYGANGEKGKSNDYYYDKRSIIVGRKGSAGEINLTEEKFWPLDVTYFVTFDDKRNNLKFLFHLLRLLELPKYAKGVKPGINRNEIYDISIQIPPLSEQNRIISIIDQTFAAIDKAKSNALQNLKNARELFESYLEGVFENRGDKLEEKRFEDLIEANQIGLIRNSKEQNANFKYKYLKMDSISFDNRLLEDKCVNVDATEYEVKKFKLDIGDFLFNTRNSYDLVGKTCVFCSNSNEITLFNNNIMRVKFKKQISSKYINYVFSSILIKKKLEKLKSGTTSVVGIYYNGLKNLRVPITDFEVQNTIVSKLDALSAETKRLEAIYQQKLLNLEELKKSILQKAFNGEL